MDEYMDFNQALESGRKFPLHHTFSHSEYDKYRQYSDHLITRISYNPIECIQMDSDPIIEENDWLSCYLNETEPKSYDLDSSYWAQILRSRSDGHLNRPGTAFYFRYPLDEETQITAREDDEAGWGDKFYQNVQANILEISIGRNRNSNRELLYMIKTY